ncbi:MAG: 16S rRNA (guanine(966)-N(2))-methyltransferase RsmD, partial [Nitrospirota bacterium]
MRISAGTAKGRKTATAKLLSRKQSGERLRPTSSRVREALFDIVRNRLQGAHFVDLYAGSGTVGLEAVSRGAGKATFVEPDTFRAEIIKKNAVEFGFGDRAEVVRTNARIFLERAASGRKHFDIMFLDPPYQSDEIEQVLPLIGGGEILRDDGVV